MAGVRKYSDIRVPILAIYAMPGDLELPVNADPAGRAAYESSKITDAQASAFESGVPTAHVIRLSHADHYVFLSNEEDVLREMKAFLGTLP